MFKVFFFPQIGSHVYKDFSEKKVPVACHFAAKHTKFSISQGSHSFAHAHISHRAFFNHHLIKLLKIPHVNLQSAGERSFHFATMTVWNSLPSNVPNITNLPQIWAPLKTHMSHQAF